MGEYKGEIIYVTRDARENYSFHHLTASGEAADRAIPSFEGRYGFVCVWE